MKTRRDLLKFFGAGTLITGATAASPIARLIEVPSVEIVTAQKIPTAVDFVKVKAATVRLEMEDGQFRDLPLKIQDRHGTWPISKEAFVTIEVIGQSSPWTMVGEIRATSKLV